MRKNILILCIFLISVLFIYTATSKFIDLPRFRHDLLNQPFPHWMSKTAVWLVPSLEILAVVLLFFEPTRLSGLWLAWGLIFLFTIYTGLVLGKTFGRIPCGCGGFIRELSWTQHLLLNVFYLITASTALVLQCQLELIKLFHAHETGQTENL